MFYCFYRVYMKSIGIMHVFIVHKFIVILIITVWAFVIGVFNYVFYFYQWEHILTTILMFFIPMLIIFISFLTNMLFNRQLGIEDKQISFLILVMIFLSYLILWGPFKVTELMHRYCCQLPGEHENKIRHIVSAPVAIKCYITPIILIIMNKKFREEFFTKLIFCIPRRKRFSIPINMNNNSNPYNLTICENDELKNGRDETHEDYKQLIE